MADTNAEWVKLQIGVMRHLVATDFPYDTPRVVPGSDLSGFFFDGHCYWYIYRFIEGVPAVQPKTRGLAKSVGVLVGHYDRALELTNFDVVAGISVLDLFEIDRVAESLSETREWMRTTLTRSELRRGLIGNVDAVLQTQSSIQHQQIRQVFDLKKIVVYNDWHPNNMLMRSGKVCGLIDYDSVIGAPRIVDFQNALTHVLISRGRVDRDLMRVFTEGYTSVVALSRSEISLIYPVMLDRVIWLISYVLERIRVDSSRVQERIAARLIQLLSWLKDNGEGLTKELATYAGRR